MKTNHHNFRFIYTLALVGFLALTTGCSTMAKSWPAYQGTIIDKDTRSPLSDTVVLASWLGAYSSFLGHGGVACFYMASAKTDDNGRYVLPAWKNEKERGKGTEYQTVTLHVYRAGYEYQYVHEKVSTDMEIKLKPFDGSKKDIYENWGKMEVWTRCSGAGESGKARYLFLHAMYEEGMNIANSDEEIRKVKRIESYALDALKSTDAPRFLTVDDLK